MTRCCGNGSRAWPPGQTASRRADEIAPGLRRALAGGHVVFFREDAAAVTVVRVLHQSMDVG
jgi:toxin ParE1/3/4